MTLITANTDVSVSPKDHRTLVDQYFIFKYLRLDIIMLMNQDFYSTKSRTCNFTTLVDLFGISDKGRALVALVF